MSKYDLTDGFYRIFLAPDDALKLTIMMPHYDGETQLAAMPLSLTMHWTKSLPMFSPTSETATDLTNAQLTTQQNQLPCHHLEDLASAHDTWDPPPLVTLSADNAMLAAGLNPSLTPRWPVAHMDVYMDDFIGLAQGSRELCQDTRRCIMHAINQIFAQPDERTLNRKEAVSEKKMNKGDGSWSQ